MRINKGLIAVILLSISSPALSGEVFMSLSGGLFIPQQKEHREMYGSAFPLSLQTSFSLPKPLANLGVSAGVEFFRNKGTALGAWEESYPLRLRMTTFPLFIFLKQSVGQKIRILVGYGASYNIYQEKWETVDLEFNDKKWGYLLNVASEYLLLPRLNALLQLRYESLPSEMGSILVEKVNLGGVKMLAGLSYRLF
jgi:hypothetical protein